MEQGNNPTNEYMAETKSISEYMAETKSTNGVCGQGQPTPVTSTPQDKTKITD